MAQNIVGIHASSGTFWKQQQVDAGLSGAYSCPLLADNATRCLQFHLIKHKQEGGRTTETVPSQPTQ